MNIESGWRAFLGPVLLLLVSFVIYQLRYPLWFSLKYVEWIFVMLIVSYSAVFILAVILLKRDSRKSISNVFKTSGYSTVIAGVVLALLYLGIRYLTSFALGGRFEFASFPSLSGYESYSVYLLPLAFSLQLVFVVFGAFTEEVAYRGYVQTRIRARYSLTIGILVSALFFSLQHIQFFVLSWVEDFFQTQFLQVILFGIFVGYFFFKSRDSIWSVFSFHAVVNILSVSIPIIVTASFPFANQLADIPSFAVIMLLIHCLL